MTRKGNDDDIVRSGASEHTVERRPDGGPVACVSTSSLDSKSGMVSEKSDQNAKASRRQPESSGCQDQQIDLHRRIKLEYS
jgi:hypothetical protein